MAYSDIEWTASRELTVCSIAARANVCLPAMPTRRDFSVRNVNAP